MRALKPSAGTGWSLFLSHCRSWARENELRRARYHAARDARPNKPHARAPATRATHTHRRMRGTGQRGHLTVLIIALTGTDNRTYRY